MTDDRSTRDCLLSISEGLKHKFASSKRLLTFAEYLALVEQAPRTHARGTAQYLRDMMAHYGTEAVAYPRGKIQRFKMFDAPWDDGEAALIGQEEVQNALYRLLNNFVRQRRIDRLILLHGPNGSSKSTVTEMLARAMEHYSTLDEGALYRFNWIFPTGVPGRKGIGFQRDARADPRESYARLEEGEIDARLPCELRDHPLLLLPREQRAAFLDPLLAQGGEEELILADYIAHGNLCHKCKLIYEALLTAYDGDYLQVLRHVQVERFFVSRRYRIGSGRVEPQFAVDARTRQVTADRSLSALPSALQHVSLHEVGGELVDANRGVLDFADILKRPPEAWKYLLTTVEGGRVAVDVTNLFVDLLFIGSANEHRLHAFMESPEWASFKARIELIRVPYIRDHKRERRIYAQQVTQQQLAKHIAPHTIPAAALWAVLTRMHKPDTGRYEGAIRELVGNLKPLDKAEYYSGRVPVGLADEKAKVLRAELPQVFAETDTALVYEGSTGASPREIRAALLNAAQDADFSCVTPEAALKQIETLTKETSVYAFLRQERQGDGYFDHKELVEVCRRWYLSHADDDVRAAMGLIEETSYAELFGRYILHVTHQVRKEQLLNPVTGSYEDPDTGLMSEVEKSLGLEGDAETFRQGVMTKIGAWSLDHQGERPEYTAIFPEHFETLRRGYYEQQRRRVKKIIDDSLRVLADESSTLAPDDAQAVNQMMTDLEQRFGYCDACRREALTLLARHRYAD